MQVETLRRSAFDFILAPEAAVLPINHEHDVICARAYLERIELDDAVTAFAAELSLAVNRDTLRFLNDLNRQLFADFFHVHRDTGHHKARHILCRAAVARAGTWQCYSLTVADLKASLHVSQAATRKATCRVSGVTCMPGRKCTCLAPVGADSIPPMAKQ